MLIDSPKYKFFFKLKGVWSVNREIENFGLGEGIAVFKLIDEYSLHYREDLIVKPNDALPYEAYREYIYKYLADQDKIVKYFLDLKHFADLENAEHNKQFYGSHLCLKDTYNIFYEFRDDDNFIITYQIKGPKKDYSIKTSFTRKK